MDDNTLPDIARQAITNTLDLVRWDQELAEADRTAGDEARAVPHRAPPAAESGLAWRPD